MHTLLLLCLLSLFLSNGGLTKVTSQCAPSSCGDLHDIHYPFRLKTDPSHCGSTDYELICDSNKPYLEWYSGRYYVTNISYTNQTINMVDPAFTDHNSCEVPRNTADMDVYLTKMYFKPCGFNLNVAYFVNCIEKIQNYQLYVPCTSRNNSYIYVLSGKSGYVSVSDLQPSCRYMNASTFVRNDKIASSTAQVSDISSLVLQEGFTLCWNRPVEGLGYCLKLSARYFIDMLIGEVPTGKIFLWTRVPTPINLPLISPLFSSDLLFLECMSFSMFESTLVVFFVLPILQFFILLMIFRRFIFLPFVLCVFLTHKYRRSKAPVDYVERFLREHKAIAPTRYSFTNIIAITGHFREKLGEGGFGSVFKGRILNNRLVAIKMLGNSKLHGDEFINEVSTLGWIHHRNIVQLLGFCSEGATKALVYEYMPNGSLDKHIFYSEKTSHARPFSWDKLKEIALGVARGIDYLHQECAMRILHFDIKPHNVLLDHNFVPKISDFGLAKLYPKELSMVSISIAKGTTGYIAPEMVSRNFGAISHKSDVYSFGMLLLDMAGSRRNWNISEARRVTSGVYYPSWIYDQLVRQENNEISTEIEEMEANLCKIGLWCIQMKQSDRPPMSKVVELLERESVDTLPMPLRPFFSSSLSNQDGFGSGS